MNGEPHVNGKWGFFLLRLRYRDGRVIDTAGNEPVLLDDDQFIWIVYEGKVDVFLTAIQDGKPVGARRHLFRAEKGDGLFGMALNGNRIGLLASSGPGTQLLKVRRAG